MKIEVANNLGSGDIVKHIKSNRTYEIIAFGALLESDKTPMVVYRSTDINKPVVLIRPVDKFCDRRFQLVQKYGTDRQYDHSLSNQQLIAIKHNTSVYGEWCICPLDFWLKRACIPDSHLNIRIFGMEEVSDHTYITKDGSDGIELLKMNGIEIINNPVWYFQKPNYKDPDVI